MTPITRVDQPNRNGRVKTFPFALGLAGYLDELRFCW
jgi:hypothetical protein